MQRKKRFSKRFLALLLAGVLAAGLLAGCGKEEEPENTVRVGGLKGPTTMGIVFMMENAKNGKTKNQYEFQVAVGADELLPLMIKGQLDIALIPANVASILYEKTNGGVCVIDINTLGVLSLVTGDENFHKIEDLEGRTVYLTGKGTTPDYVLQYLLEQKGVKNCTLEYKSEATEVAAVLAEKPGEVGLLPQPFVTVACMQNEALSAVVSLDDVWKEVQGDEQKGMVTGVTVVRREFLMENEEAVKNFLADHQKSVQLIKSKVDKGAAYCVNAGIVGQEAIAKKAIPDCNISCITGEAMKQSLENYLQVLYDRAPESVGGTMPGGDFYYTVVK